MYTERLLSKARERVYLMDAEDRANGIAAPADSDLVSHASAVAEAIRAGISTSNWDCVADAWVMLEQLIGRVRGQ